MFCRGGDRGRDPFWSVGRLNTWRENRVNCKEFLCFKDKNLCQDTFTTLKKKSQNIPENKYIFHFPEDSFKYFALNLFEVQFKTTCRFLSVAQNGTAWPGKNTVPLCWTLEGASPDEFSAKKQKPKQGLERMWKKGSPCALLVGTQIGVATVENSIEFPQKTKNGTASHGWCGSVDWPPACEPKTCWFDS